MKPATQVASAPQTSVVSQGFCIALNSTGLRHLRSRECDDDTSLSDLIDRHIAVHRAKTDAFRAWHLDRAVGRSTSISDANELSRVAREDEAGRLAILNFGARNRKEASMKLTYLAAYLIATRGTLSVNEMNLIQDGETG